MILPAIVGVLIGVAIGFIIAKAIEKAKGKKVLEAQKRSCYYFKGS